MSSKIKIDYVREYGLCDENHFHIVKGISIIAALISYVCMKYLAIPNLQFVPLIAAAVFAFCSGYGLSESYLRKGGLVHYWENKMVKVWLPSLAVMVLVSFVRRGNALQWIVSSPLGLKGNMLYLIFGGYAVFWVVFQFAEKVSARLVTFFGISAAVFLMMPDSLTIKMAIPALAVGVMFSQLKWRRAIREFTWKGNAVVFAACAAFGAGTWFLAERITIPGLEVLLWALSYTAIGMLLILGTYFAKAIPVFGVFVPFGMVSYALYLLYDEVLVLLKGQTDWRTYAIIVLALCVASAILTVLRELLIAWNRKLRRRKKPRLKGSMW